MRTRLINKIRIFIAIAFCAIVLSTTHANSQTLSGSAGAQSLRENAANAEWAYNWGIEPNHDVNEANFEFVPMIWSGNPGGVQAQIDRVKNLESNYGVHVDYVLGFNEPELPTQANMTVATAIDTWDVITNEFENTDVKLVSPAVSGGGAITHWLDPFMQEVENRNIDTDPDNDLQVDAIAYHFYTVAFNPLTEANKLLGHIDQLWADYGLPIWLTEFAGTSFSLDNPIHSIEERTAFNEEFLEILIPEFEARPYLERFAWWQFGALGQPYSRLSTSQNGVFTPTGIGEVFAGALEVGDTIDFVSGESNITDVHYMKGGTLTNTGASMSVALRAIDALEGDSTIEGTADYELAADLDAFVRVRSGAVLRKRGTNSVTFNGPEIFENQGEIHLEEGTMNILGGVPITGDGHFYSLAGTTLHLTDTVSIQGDGDFILEGNITGSVGLVKTGIGDLLLGGDSSYDGVTAIRGGKLIIANSTGSATGTSRVQVGSNTILAGHGSIGDEVTVAGAGSVSPGTTTGAASPPSIDEGVVINAIDFDFTGIQDDGPLTQTSTLSSALELTSGFNFGPGAEARNAGNEGNEFNVMGFTGGGSYSDAAAANDYLTFSVQPVAGLTMEIDDITFELRRNGSGAAKNYQVFTSVDGFVSGEHLGSELVLDSTNTSTQTYTVDYDGGESVSDDVEVRLYGWNATSSFGNTHIYAVSLDASFTTDPNNIVLDPIGILEIGGDYVQQDFAILEIELSGTSNSDSENPEFDQLVILGDAEIDGTLDLSFIDGFAGTIGQTFDIITANSITGTFSEVILPESMDITINYLSSSVQVQIVDPQLSGDFNNDGIVDAADYTLWRDNLGAADELAINGNGDGLNGIDQADYDLWVSNYGANNATTSSAAVPEPTSISMAFLLLGTSALFNRNRMLSK